MPKTLAIGSLIIIVVATVACQNAMQLVYPKPPAAPASKGLIAVVMEDQRIPERGGNDPLTVGIVRNTFGMPFSLKAAPDREPTKVLRELLADCLAAGGYEVIDDPSRAPRLHAVVNVFWSDGYQHSRMGLLMPLALGQDADGPPVWDHSVDINTGKTWGMGGFSQFNQGFNHMLEAARDDLLKQFGSQEFGNAYRSLK